MNLYLGYPETKLKEKGALYTASEIEQQPALWREISESFQLQEKECAQFLENIPPGVNKIILTGAGTSAFIGLSLKGLWQKNLQIFTEAVATTHFVTHPQEYISDKDSLLLVSFARSGNSPESVAAFNLAEQLCKKVFHIIITCNAKGELAQRANKHNTFLFTLPEKANDKSLAMTSSYTGMLLSGILIAESFCGHDYKNVISNIAEAGEHFLKTEISKLKNLADMQFERAVFLGSGSLYGTAEEAHLKMQELTDGKVVCKYDSFLGFRHGPKAVVNDKTLMMYFLAANDYTKQYEQDLTQAMQRGKKPLLQIAVSADKTAQDFFDQTIIFDLQPDETLEIYLPLLMILPAQVLSFYKSLQLCLQPDNPSVSGAISRVVEGVNIYPYKTTVLQ